MNIIKKLKNLLLGVRVKESQQYTSKQIPILEEQLRLLLKDDKSDDGVVISLQGRWGIGKTYFWNDFAEHTWNENQQVYISLFGKHTLDDIKKQIVLKVYDRNKIAKFIDKNPIIGKIIETKWGVDASMVANAFTKETFKGIVLCFDDFERISPNLSITEVLGFIAELKEQNQCKIVLINNNDSLKEHDELNHSKTIQTDENGNKKELHITTKTSNQEIFDKFSEKIIDFKLYYEPHYNDNLNLIKDESLEFVDWALVEELLAGVSDPNKKFNIRPMKQLVSKLKLFQDSLASDINQRISNAIVAAIFQKIFEIDGYETNNFELANISILMPFVDETVKKHFLEKDGFWLTVQRLNAELNQNYGALQTHDKVKEIYNRFLYELAYSNTDFVKEMLGLFESNKQDIVKIVSASSFQWYIELLVRVDDGNKEKYETFYIEAMKYYIDYIVTDKTIPSYIVDDETHLFENNSELKTYYEQKRQNFVHINASNIDSVMAAMKELKRKSSWHSHDEEMLNSITISQHKQWMQESKEYLKTCFDFVRWVKGFSGTKPFQAAYGNVMESIKELAQKDEYKIKLQIMLDFFEKEKQ